MTTIESKLTLDGGNWGDEDIVPQSSLKKMLADKNGGKLVWQTPVEPTKPLTASELNDKMSDCSKSMTFVAMLRNATEDKVMLDALAFQTRYFKIQRGKFALEYIKTEDYFATVQTIVNIQMEIDAAFMHGDKKTHKSLVAKISEMRRFIKQREDWVKDVEKLC
jgi:hypothetical protein